MKYLDKTLCALLLLGSVLHVFGTLTTYAAFTEVWVWSLGSSLAAGLIAILNWLRAARANDRVLVAVIMVASLLWVAVDLGFGTAIGNVADFRVIWHAACGLGLAGFGVAALRKGL
jgi:hypothetical protein